jgi:hypothetical protein
MMVYSAGNCVAHKLPTQLFHLKNIPYMIVGDDAFPLKPYLMKPYPNRNLGITQRVFNYRLFRVRRIVENVFGIYTKYIFNNSTNSK